MFRWVIQDDWASALNPSASFGPVFHGMDTSKRLPSGFELQSFFVVSGWARIEACSFLPAVCKLMKICNWTKFCKKTNFRGVSMIIGSYKSPSSLSGTSSDLLKNPSQKTGFPLSSGRVRSQRLDVRRLRSCGPGSSLTDPEMCAGARRCNRDDTGTVLLIEFWCWDRFVNQPDQKPQFWVCLARFVDNNAPIYIYISRNDYGSMFFFNYAWFEKASLGLARSF